MTRTQKVAPGCLFGPWHFIPNLTKTQVVPPGTLSLMALCSWLLPGLNGGPWILYHLWHFVPGSPKTQEVAPGYSLSPQHFAPRRLSAKTNVQLFLTLLGSQRCTYMSSMTKQYHRPHESIVAQSLYQDTNQIEQRGYRQINSKKEEPSFKHKPWAIQNRNNNNNNNNQVLLKWTSLLKHIFITYYKMRISWKLSPKIPISSVHSHNQLKEKSQEPFESCKSKPTIPFATKLRKFMPLYIIHPTIFVQHRMD